jgi:SAM-dependent methyltransferase
MIQLEDALKTMENDRIGSLDTTSFSRNDVLNLILQRSEIIGDQPNHHRYIKAWTAGQNQPLLDLIDTVGEEHLIRRAAALILLEYEELRPIFEKAPPKAVTDIGCGYAFFDLFLAQDFNCKLTLIDLETNDERHFGFEDSGSAYSNLEVAARFLNANGIAKSRIKTLNPAARSPDRLRGQDLVVSFISCGFHYPWSTYSVFFRDAVAPGGRIILDIRRRGFERTKAELSALGDVVDLDAGFTSKAVRVMVTRKG